MFGGVSFKLDGENDGLCPSSNIYAAPGSWGDIEKSQKMMKTDKNKHPSVVGFISTSR